MGSTHLVAFSLGPIPIYRYGLMYFTSFAVSYAVLRYGARQGRYRNLWARNILTQDLDGLFMALLLGVLIGGRMGDVVIYNFDYFLHQPLKIFAVWEGGMSFIGGIIGVVISSWIYISYFSPLKNSPRKDIFSLLDALIPLVPIGIALGRLGNFLNQELYGRVVDKVWTLSDSTTSFLYKIGLLHIYPTVGPELRINTNLLSIIFEGVVIAIVLRVLYFYKVSTRRRPSGILSLIFLALYSGVRFFLEYVREDSQSEFLGIFTRSQWFFVVFFVIALVGIILLSARKNSTYTRQ